MSQVVQSSPLLKVSIATTHSARGNRSNSAGGSRAGRGCRHHVWAFALLLIAACQVDGPRKGAEDASVPSDVASNDGGATKIRCGELLCTAPAVCVASIEAARCRCPIGYLDVRGDGSDCRDVNECVIPGICDRNGKCTNTRGSFQCECAGPELQALGNRCVCSPGYTRSSTGECLAQDGTACRADDNCLNRHCESGICCAVACDRPSECHTAEAASCSDGKTCSYPAVSDGTACDDARACTTGSVCTDGKCGGGRKLSCEDNNPCTDDSCDETVGCRNINNHNDCDDADACTLNDTCSAGACNGERKRCESESDACNIGSCDGTTGACGTAPRANGARCDDADSCTSSERCEAGSCKPDAAAPSACGPHAIACSSAQPHNTCSCAEGFVDNGRGRCAPPNDECSGQSVCSPDAECDDPSARSGDAVCTCKKGWTGDGRSCTAVDGCLGNPCGDGRGTCVSGAPGEHSCQCGAGFVAADGGCACDLSGAFAVRTRAFASWSGQSELIEPGSDVVLGYALVRFSYDEEGKLQLEQTPCGDGAFDLCGLGSAPLVAPEAYAPYIPTSTWERASVPKVKLRVHPGQLISGAAFETDVAAHLHGISLSDPSGPWPKTRRAIAGGTGFAGSAVNGARWLDQDDDGFVGLTSYLVPPGGASADDSADAPPPPRAYGASSPVCPRAGGPHTPYAYVPAPADGSTGGVVRVKRYYSAFRSISAYKGKLDSCDQISGDLVGKDGAPVQLDIRIGGCIRQHESGETACADSAIDFLDKAVASEAQLQATFKLVRLPSGAAASCSTVRGLAYE